MKILPIQQRWKRTTQRLPGWAAALLASLLITSCGPGLTPAPLSTPRVLAVQVTPSLQPLADRFQACALRLANTGLVVLETTAPSLDLNRAPLALRWGGSPPGQEYAAVLGQEDLVIVANPHNPVQNLSLDNLQSIYSGRLTAWTGFTQAGPVQPWAYPAGDDIQQIFQQAVLRGDPFSYRAASTAPDPKAMREAVSDSPSAIGFLPRRWLDSTVKALSIDGLDPADMRHPILVLSKSEPKDPEKAWLICLQEQLSE